MNSNLERLRYLAKEGDAQAAAELARQEQRHGSVIPTLLERLRDAHARSDDDKARALVFGLHCAGYDQLRWRMMGVEGVYYRTETVPLITGKRGAPDHFKGSSRHRNATQRAVAFPGPHGLLLLPLLWDQSVLDMARSELAAHALYWGRKVDKPGVWEDLHVADLIDLAAQEIHSPPRPPSQSTPMLARELARLLRNHFGTCHPDQSPPRMAASILRVVLEAQDPTATIDHLRALVTAARVYTRRLLDGITEGEGVATRKDLARMLAALYCGCDYSITPTSNT